MMAVCLGLPPEQELCYGCVIAADLPALLKIVTQSFNNKNPLSAAASVPLGAERAITDRPFHVYC